LNVVPVIVPPLRERREDIPILANQFRERFARKHGVQVLGISPVCMADLQQHNWPGNVRELQNVIERAVILCNEGGVLETGHHGMTSRPMELSSQSTPRPIQALGAVSAAAAASNDFQTLSEIEKQHILMALEHCKGNRTHAAKMLDISIRTLRNKLNEYGYKSQETATATASDEG